MNALAKATRVRVVTNPYDLSPKDLGYAENVEERIVKTDNWVFVEKYMNPKQFPYLLEVALRGWLMKLKDRCMTLLWL